MAIIVFIIITALFFAVIELLRYLYIRGNRRTRNEKDQE